MARPARGPRRNRQPPQAVTTPADSYDAKTAGSTSLHRELQLARVRALRGPNIFRLAPVVTANVVPGRLAGLPAGEIRAITARVCDAVADSGISVVPPHEGDPGPDGIWAHLVARLALWLQNQAGSTLTWSCVMPAGESDALAVAVEYEEEGVGLESLWEARDLIRAAVADDARRLDLAPVIADLRRRYEKEHLGPTATVLLEAARSRGIPIRRAPGDPVVQLGLGRVLKRIDATLTSMTNVIATDITSNKDRTKQVLGRVGVPVPRGGVALTVDEALDIADDIGYPVLIKPLDANNGRGTSPRLDSAAEVPAAFARAKAEHPEVVVETFAEGHDHRVLVVNGRVVAVAERVPARVIGDGRRTIRELAVAINADPQRDKNDPVAPLAPIPLDELTSEFLARGGRTLDSVPQAGEVVYMRSTANISTGGTPIDRTDAIHPDNAAICAFAADAVGLDVAGIDVLTPDIAVPFRENGAVIIEVNASPGIRMHTDPVDGAPRDVPGAVLDMLFPAGSQTTIPVIAVTGTNGKTTTTRLIAHLFRAAGNRVGFTTTDGVYYEDRVLLQGDMTGPMAADMVLSNPRVDVAVLETARGGILRAGLGYDSCDVGVVLNVTSDHLGIGGVHTVEQLGEVKALLPRVVKPTGYAVLNADDPLVAAMSERTPGTAAWFTMHSLREAPRVSAHVAGGGYAVTLEQERIVLHRGHDRTAIADVAEVPLTLHGAARFQVQNVSAAVLAAACGGATIEAIRAGLATFRPSAVTTPGRMNQFELHGATVVIDYAHNVAAISALIEYAMRVKATRRILVYGSPGDRRDEDIRAVGALGAGVDIVIFKEDPKFRRGREPGATIRLLRDGLETATMHRPHVLEAIDESVAVQLLRGLIAPGDLVLFLADDAKAVTEELQA